MALAAMIRAVSAASFRGCLGYVFSRPKRPRIRLLSGANAAVGAAALAGILLAATGCGPDSVAGYSVWVAGEQPGGLIVSVATPAGAPGGPITAFYAVPVGELRRDAAHLRLGYGDASAGIIRVMDVGCRVLDQVAVGAGSYRVSVSATGTIALTPYDRWGPGGPPADAPPLEPAPTNCPPE